MATSDDTQDERVIFHAAMALPDVEERRILLRRVCGDDSKLHSRVEALLSAHAHEELLNIPAAERDAPFTTNEPIREHQGSQIGRYKLLEQIGEGGFGVVYMAEQQEPIERKVALKIIKPGMDTKQVIARFEAERQALALMDHPNIGRILDAGATETGRPYFVMELVRGVPITEYCGQRRLSTKERLELFAEACSAIEHAHQKGIIHRDIKPTNILVYNNGERAVPKVIDFGIAKATQGRLTDKTLFTQFHQFIGTPAYMSPEQAQMSGVDVDTRSDVYSLGVLLYEMLTGKTPLDFKNLKAQAYDEACRKIREDDAVMPSKRVSTLTQDELSWLANSQQVTASEIAKRLRGDLDWIVMKALEKDRSHRYRSTEALSTDIRRHLNDEPVLAGPPSFGYLARKLYRRHRTAALTALAVAVALLLAAIVSSVGWRNSIVSRRAAEVSKQQAYEEKRRAIELAYLADMQTGHQARDQKRLGLARRILDLNQHFEPENDPRHWEYRALWARCQGNAERSFGVEDGSINSLSVHPDGKVIATGGHRIRVWDVNSGKLMREFPTEGVGRFAPNGDLLYTTEPSGLVRAWRVPGFESTDFKISHGSMFSYRRDIQISPNGKFLATFGDDSDVVIWDMETMKPLKPVSTGMMYCQLVFSPDSSKLALGGEQRIRIVDLVSMEVADFLDDSGKPLEGRVAFSSDERQIARSYGPRLAIHQILDGGRIAESQQHHQAILDLDYSQDGATLATASLDRTVLLHDMKTHEIIAELWNHDLAVSHVAFLPDGRLISGGFDGRICVWNVDDAKKPTDWPISVPAAYKWNGWRYWPAISCSPDGSTIASTNLQVRVGSPPGTKPKPGITLRSAVDLQVDATLAESSGEVRAVLYSPADDLLVISNEAGDLEFMTPDANGPDDNGEDDSVEHSIHYPGGILVPVRFTADGMRLLVVVKEHAQHNGNPHDDQKTICLAIYRVSDRQQIAKWTLPPESCATISRDGSAVVTGHHDGVRFWSMENRVTSTHVPVGGFRAGTAGRIWSVDFSPDGRYVIAGANINGRIEIVDVHTKKSLGQFQGHIGTVGAVRFSPDGKRVASGGGKSADTVKIWDFESRREIMNLTVDGSWGGTRHLEWLHDGNAIMVGTGDSILSIFRVPSMTEILTASNNSRKKWGPD